MGRLLAVGHVTWDARKGGEVLGGSVSYASLASRRLGWEAAVLTTAASDFAPARDLSDVSVFLAPSAVTTRFENTYGPDGERMQRVSACAAPIELGPIPESWKDPDALLLCPVAGEIRGGLARSFEAEVVGAIAQGWLRGIEPDGSVVPREFQDAAQALEGVHVLFLSEKDVPNAEAQVPRFRELVPIVALTRGWRGATLYSRDGVHDVPGLPRPEVDPTGAGDVFAAGFLVGYHESHDPLEAAAFATCVASCVVEGVAQASLGDRAEVARRLLQRERLIEEGEWDE
jgi:sugar/nucleoside kinase (ribokinase family)